MLSTNIIHLQKLVDLIQKNEVYKFILFSIPTESIYFLPATLAILYQKSYNLFQPYDLS